MRCSAGWSARACCRGGSHCVDLCQWAKQSDAEKKEFVDLYTQIVRDTYLTKIDRWFLSKIRNIVEIEENARKKLARDLHDGPTQSIAAIAMRLNYVRKLCARLGA
jgi:signal transduction histidine kinase